MKTDIKLGNNIEHIVLLSPLGDLFDFSERSPSESDTWTEHLSSRLLGGMRVLVALPPWDDRSLAFDS